MEGLTDKLLLLLSGMFLLFLDKVSVLSVVLYLIVLILLCLDELIKDIRLLRLVFLVFTLVSFFFRQAAFFLPCAAYLLFFRERTWLYFLAFLPELLRCLGMEAPTSLFLVSLFLLFAAALADRRRGLCALSCKYHELRDNAKEEELSLKQQTHLLQQEQDNQIQIATLSERTRIAREIHDNVGHLLSRSLLQVGAMLTVNKDDEALLLLKESLDDAMNGIRESVHNLRDDAVELKSSMELLLSDCRGYRTNLSYELSQAPPAPVTYCFLTIAKEAIANTIKHSSADSISVKLQEFTSLYQLSIADNGTGAVLPKTSFGMGLENMKERTNALHGTIRFSVQNGFRIFVTIPKEEEK